MIREDAALGGGGIEQAILAFFHHYGDILFILLGLYSMGGAIKQWKWFVQDRRARKVAGRTGGTTGMRIFYVVLGLGFCIVGLISFMTGISVLYIIPMIKADPLSVFELL
ncbi:Imm17 family immunity protein [uncultured Megasphaera sp.]|uniref:Imm17 family immunity protein n=1 Tax=uncultured Megasphaera sp. TaxID=165188 RepID=UPI0025977EBC|nr:Imm17 family immunity protein [uncultured Megasphaera sp.]